MESRDLHQDVAHPNLTSKDCTMIDRNNTAPTVDEDEFSRALEYSPEGLELLKTDGVPVSLDRGGEGGATRNDLRDAAWANQLWQ